MTIRLLHRRAGRAFTAPEPDPAACHCTVKHPRTPAERERVERDIALARWNGQVDLVTYLTESLAAVCRTGDPDFGYLCHCGCGRPPGQHNTQNVELRSAA